MSARGPGASASYSNYVQKNNTLPQYREEPTRSEKFQSALSSLKDGLKAPFKGLKKKESNPPAYDQQTR